ncbi:unnamed protein product [Gongylonema pulchrum]|uniref:Reverse transcriptase domain-containing protein n=1 Tax=Gongylonema pulchrum TaxID=637853 RepID=A0A183E571_9BILA|nr:unnamed protein product [Gongylonema pulchrum]
MHLPEPEYDGDWLQNILAAASYLDDFDSLANEVDFDIPHAVYQQGLVYDIIHIPNHQSFQQSEGIDSDSSSSIISEIEEYITIRESICADAEPKNLTPEADVYKIDSRLITEKIRAEMERANSVQALNIPTAKKSTPDYSCPSTSYKAGNFFLYRPTSSEAQSRNQTLKAGKFQIEPELINRRIVSELLNSNSTGMFAAPQTDTIPAPGLRTGISKHEVESPGQSDAAKYQCGFFGSRYCPGSFMN